MFNSYTETTLLYDSDLCINCNMCVEVCPHGVFASGEKVVAIVNPTACMECGACALNCPGRAIIVESGVGCATAMMIAALRGKSLDEATCGGDVEGGECSCSDTKSNSSGCCG